jgi:hypothetical protein
MFSLDRFVPPILGFMTTKSCFLTEGFYLQVTFTRNVDMESILEIETDLLPPEKIPTAPFEFPKAWSKSTISQTDYFFRFPRECLAELENLNIELQKMLYPL